MWQGWLGVLICMLLCHSVSYYFKMLTLIFHLLSAHIWYARCPCNDNRGMPLHFSSPLFTCRPLLGSFLQNGSGKNKNATPTYRPLIGRQGSCHPSNGRQAPSPLYKLPPPPFRAHLQPQKSRKKE